MGVRNEVKTTSGTSIFVESHPLGGWEAFNAEGENIGFIYNDGTGTPLQELVNTFWACKDLHPAALDASQKYLTTSIQNRQHEIARLMNLITQEQTTLLMVNEEAERRSALSK